MQFQGWIGRWYIYPVCIPWQSYTNNNFHVACIASFFKCFAHFNAHYSPYVQFMKCLALSWWWWYWWLMLVLPPFLFDFVFLQKTITFGYTFISIVTDFWNDAMCLQNGLVFCHNHIKYELLLLQNKGPQPISLNAIFILFNIIKSASQKHLLLLLLMK